MTTSSILVIFVAGTEKLLQNLSNYLIMLNNSVGQVFEMS